VTERAAGLQNKQNADYPQKLRTGGGRKARGDQLTTVHLDSAIKMMSLWAALVE